MTRARPILRIAAALLMVASGVVHSVAGWPGFLRSIEGAGLSERVLQGLWVPWHFAGVSMVAFGLVVAAAARADNDRAMRRSWLIIGAAWLAFGVAGMLAIRPDPTFLLFLVPGGLLLAGSLPMRDT